MIANFHHDCFVIRFLRVVVDFVVVVVDDDLAAMTMFLLLSLELDIAVYLCPGVLGACLLELVSEENHTL